MAFQYRPLGMLNRLRAHVVFPLRTELNIQADQLSNEGLRVNLEGNATDLLQGMVGLISSPAPYMQASITIPILRSVPVAESYKDAMETDTLLGLCNIWPDVMPSGAATAVGAVATGGIQTTYNIQNVALESVREIAMAGLEAAIVVTCRGYYQVNTNYYIGF